MVSTLDLIGQFTVLHGYLRQLVTKAGTVPYIRVRCVCVPSFLRKGLYEVSIPHSLPCSRSLMERVKLHQKAHFHTHTHDSRVRHCLLCNSSRVDASQSPRPITNNGSSTIFNQMQASASKCKPVPTVPSASSGALAMRL